MDKRTIIKNNKGITLVALVVTIIVLIILAGVSINIVMGNDGIITRAKQAKENMEIATLEEQEQLNELYEKLNIEAGTIGSSNDAIAKLVDFKTKIATAITESGIETSASDSAETMANNIKQLGNQGSTEGSRQKLYEALQYSELVTEDMTFDEMLDVLKTEYPETYEIDILQLTADKWSASPTYNTDGSISIAVTDSNNSDINQAIKTITTVDSYDFSKCNYLQLQGTATVSCSNAGSAFAYMAEVSIINANTDTVITTYSAPLTSTNGSKAIDTIIELPDLTDINCKLRMKVKAYSNKYAMTTTMKLTTFKLYK